MNDNSRRLRIYINARFLTQSITGVQRYALELVKALDYLLETGEIDKSRFKFELLAPRWGIQHELKLKNIPLRRVGLLSGHAWEQLELPFYSRSGLLFCLGNTAPVMSLLSKQPTVVTIHSLSFLFFPEAYSTAFKVFYKQIIPLALRGGDAVITVSQSEKDYIISRYGPLQNRLHAIQNGAMDKEFLNNLQVPEAVIPEGNRPFVLYVGSLSKGKNLRGVLEAMALLNRNHDISLVVVGATGKSFNKDDFNLPEEITSKVFFKGQVDNTAELVSLYKSALCLVFPSFYEASPLPPVEAMACGCPAVVSAIPSLRERCGEAALYCNPHDPAEIAGRIEQLLIDETLRESLRQKGLGHAREISWAKCARETFTVLREVLMRSGSREIVINARFLTQSITGVQRYAFELVKALDALIENGTIDKSKYSFVLLGPRDIERDFNLKHIPLKRVGFLRGHLWEQFELPFYARNRFLIGLCNVGPMLKSSQTVTIHDAAVFGFPQAYSFAFRAWYKVLLTRLGKTASKILTDSQFSRQELTKYCKIGEDRLQVISLGKDHVFSVDPDRNILEEYHLTDRPFVLAVSSVSPNKNFHSIIQAIELLGDTDFSIVIAGGINQKVFSQSCAPLPDTVKYMGYVNDSQLRTLYEHAACFIFPSFYEGFGLPPLEAMTCGCPVIVSHAASLPEVCGDAALYCDPGNPADIADKIRLIMSDPQLRATMRQKGLERAERFTWEKCAAETFDVIKGVT